MDPIPHELVHLRQPDFPRRWCCAKRSLPIAIFTALLTLACGCQRGSLATSAGHVDFPKKPIKIIVYTKPGGPIDMTAQRFAELAQKRTGAVFVVEYKQGAGGILAMEHVLHVRADGYTILACTKSNIAKMVSSGREDYVDKLDWLALLMTDPECVITRRDSPAANWSRVISDTRSAGTEQIWGGPARGGLDHITALQIWDRFKIPARWIPYASGELAIQGLLAGEISAYVGNPGDVRGQPELTVSVLSSPARLPQFPDVPIFAEFGAPELDDLSIWRGFALRKDCPPSVRQWYADLFHKLSSDPEWRSIWEPDGIRVEHLGDSQFLQIVNADRDELRRYLARLDMLPSSQSKLGDSWFARYGFSLLLGIVGVHLAVAWMLAQSGRWEANGLLVILSLMLCLCAIMLWETTEFPVAERATAAAVPRLWMALIGTMCLVIGLRRRADSTTAPDERTKAGAARVALLALCLVAYVLAAIYLGYFSGTAIFLVAAMLLLGERRWYVLLSVSAVWLGFAYLTFSRLLYVPLPSERWWNTLF